MWVGACVALLLSDACKSETKCRLRRGKRPPDVFLGFLCSSHTCIVVSFTARAHSNVPSCSVCRLAAVAFCCKWDCFSIRVTCLTQKKTQTKTLAIVEKASISVGRATPEFNESIAPVGGDGNCCLGVMGSAFGICKKGCGFRVWFLRCLLPSQPVVRERISKAIRLSSIHARKARLATYLAFQPVLAMCALRR